MYISVGLILTPVAPYVGLQLLMNSVSSGISAMERGAREIADEVDGDVYLVYYDLDSFGAFFLNYLTPEDTQISSFSARANKRFAHCKAWFSTGPISYVTFEISADKNTGIIATK
ncbi:UNKNOWN [Stylonychia lemnae]|uniref:Uncharacterized protein n=1 Tax=Stylonychia lemnae TaxID=5949 RepID=A0A077ZQT7_STYLE|nr:UNKNOWN [Stylonychia lemnae]|eukprot:CDW72293.1 UNKNOWN [Stylonychia lemnae]